MSVDDPTTGCDQARELISAALDGVIDGGDTAHWARRHVAGCVDCADWADRATRLDRMLRLHPAQDDPDLAETILAQVRLPRRGRWRPALRVALALVALAQLALGVTSLFGPVGMTMAMPDTQHLDHEQAAFNTAFGIALALVAFNRRQARGQVPVLATFVLVLAVSSVFDLVDGVVTWSRLLTHLPVLLGLLLSTALGRIPDSEPGPLTSAPRRRGAPSHWWPAGTDPARTDRAPTSRRHRPPPAARRDVA